MSRRARAVLLAGAMLGAIGLPGAIAASGLGGAVHAAGTPARGTPRAAASAPSSEYKCPVFPPSDPLNREIANAPVSPNSGAYLASIGASAHLHPDFGTNPSYGIPYSVVSQNRRTCR